ncbi:pfkB family carbohydrate kinase [Musa troglodytarum]|uniref:PfkB family carbohydrate kinase n=1 Tax=Musa troglodytarum TaxID=320322 RepID=A0A9E7G6R1_9LILI|nr:pfkB family carbohydrate kinase [Musa troglodytarum]
MGASKYSTDEQRLREALKFANACGALTVMERGAIPALPTREAVLSALCLDLCTSRCYDVHNSACYQIMS